jgi:hypothetical protein
VRGGRRRGSGTERANRATFAVGGNGSSRPGTTRPSAARFAEGEWSAFLDGVKAGEFDLPG